MLTFCGEGGHAFKNLFLQIVSVVNAPFNQTEGQ